VIDPDSSTNVLIDPGAFKERFAVIGVVGHNVRLKNSNGRKQTR